MCGFPRPTRGSSTHTEKDGPRPPSQSREDQTAAGALLCPGAGCTRRGSGLYRPVSPQAELRGSPGPACSLPGSSGHSQTGSRTSGAVRSCTRARVPSAPLRFRPLTHGAAGGGTASPERPVGRRGPGRAAAPRGTCARPDSPALHEPWAAPCGGRGGRGTVSPRAEGGSSGAKRGSSQTHPRLQSHPRPPSQAAEVGRPTNPFFSPRACAPTWEYAGKCAKDILSKGTEAQARHRKAT